MRALGNLSAQKVTRLDKPGRYADGGGLYLQISRFNTKAWLFRFTREGRAREMGLGSFKTISLAEARDRARKCRQSLLDGVDPIEARHSALIQRRTEEAHGISFKHCAEKYIAAHESGWRNNVHRAQWKATLATYVYPVIGHLPASAVDIGLVLKVIEPIWQTKTETANRVRGRIEKVLSWAIVRGYRSGPNPAAWKDHLDKLLPSRGKVKQIKHHAALPYAETPGFMSALREHKGISARAFELTILNALRTGEVIGAKWDEIDMEAKIWTIPAERTKSAREHRVPLSHRSITILRQLPREADYVFPGSRTNEALSNKAMLTTLRRMGRDDLTVHGFRSTFRDWAAESTNYPNHVVEMALAHTVGDKVEAAYRRGDLFDKRRHLMAEWARFCTTLPNEAAHDRKVVPLRRGAAQ